MFRVRCHPLLLAAGLCAASAAQADHQAPAAPTGISSGPLDATAPVPPAAHRSAFDGYRGLTDGGPAPSWREANDRVGRIGGWRSYAREAAAQDAAPAPAGSAASSPSGHGGHPGHSGGKP